MWKRGVLQKGFFLVALVILAAAGMSSYFSSSDGTGAVIRLDEDPPYRREIPVQPDPPIFQPVIPPEPPKPTNHVVYGAFEGSLETNEHVTTDSQFTSLVGRTDIVGSSYRPISDSDPDAELDDKYNVHAIWYNHDESSYPSLETLFYSKLSYPSSKQWSSEMVKSASIGSSYIELFLSPIHIFYSNRDGPILLFEEYERRHRSNSDRSGKYNWKVYVATKSTTQRGPCSNFWDCSIVFQKDVYTRGFFDGKPVATLLPSGNIYMVVENAESASNAEKAHAYEFTPKGNILKSENLFTSNNQINMHVLDVEPDSQSGEPVVLVDVKQSSSSTRELLLIKKSSIGCKYSSQVAWGCKVIASQFVSPNADLVFEGGKPVVYYLNSDPSNPGKTRLEKSIDGSLEVTGLGPFYYDFSRSSSSGRGVYADSTLDVEIGFEGTHITVTEFDVDASMNIKDNKIHYYVYKQPGRGKCGLNNAYDHCRILPFRTPMINAPVNPDLAVMK